MSKRLLAWNFSLRLGVQLAQRISGFIVFPLIVTYLAVEGYGYYTLAMSTALIYASVLTLRLPLAVVRFYSDDRESAGPVVAVGLLFWLLLALLSVLVLATAGDRLAEYVFNAPGKTKLLAAAVAYGLCYVLYDFVNVTLVAENRFGFISVTDALERIAYIGICVSLFALGYCTAEAVLALLAFTTFCKVLIVGTASLKNIKWSLPQLALAKAMLLFAMPHVPYVASNWVIERSPFFFVAEGAGIIAAGVFGIAATLAFLVASAVGPVQQVLYPLIRKAYDDGRTAMVQELATTAIRGILLVCVFGTICVCLGGRYLFELMSIGSEAPRSSLVLVLAVGASAGAIRAVMVNLVSVISRTKVLLWTAPSGALISLVFYSLFVHENGWMMVAFGLMLGNSMQVALMATQVPRQLLPVPTWGFLFALAGSVAVAGLIQWGSSVLGAWPYLGGLIVSGIVYLGISYRFGAFTDSEKRALAGIMRARWSRMVPAGR